MLNGLFIILTCLSKSISQSISLSSLAMNLGDRQKPSWSYYAIKIRTYL